MLTAVTAPEPPPGIIERIKHTHPYRLTPRGRAVAVLFTKLLEAGFGFGRPDGRYGQGLGTAGADFGVGAAGGVGRRVEQEQRGRDGVGGAVPL